MDFAMGFNGSVLGQSIWSKTTFKHSLCTVPVNRPRHHQQPQIKTLPQFIYKKRLLERKLFAAPSSDFNFDISPLSPTHTIMQFYYAINEKNLKQLGTLIAEDCFFEDYSFPKPFQGKKETLRFLEQLTSSMGQNMQFNVEHICEGNDSTAGVNWHLDWNKIQVPFTRGCSFYSLSTKGDKLVIKKAQVHIESPIKLGALALTIFKMVNSLFDAFPAATEWFLKSPHVIFQLVLKTYRISVQPIITPFFAWYIKLLNYVACLLSFSLKIIYYIAKFLNM
ncbi:hypothetical protein ACJIZ3_008199 [Penstemon smallii]|uniref:SnoaL-like domain-containing protein n=1 Tax=Penstemon smallii TaxID=265156 RepID=A0ABD3TB27_9LAMI